jgi:hypothetical protein
MSINTVSVIELCLAYKHLKKIKSTLIIINTLVHIHILNFPSVALIQVIVEKSHSRQFV